MKFTKYVGKKFSEVAVHKSYLSERYEFTQPVCFFSGFIVQYCLVSKKANYLSCQRIQVLSMKNVNLSPMLSYC